MTTRLLRPGQDLLRRHRVTALVHIEQARQQRLWGEQNHTDLMWLPILGEEMGEVNKAINCLHHHDENGNDYAWDSPEANLKEELVHVAAVAMTWLEAIERRELSD